MAAFLTTYLQLSLHKLPYQGRHYRVKRESGSRKHEKMKLSEHIANLKAFQPILARKLANHYLIIVFCMSSCILLSDLYHL